MARRYGKNLTATLGFRCDEELKSRIDSEVARTGRSLSDVLLDRLRGSFQPNERLAKKHGEEITQRMDRAGLSTRHLLDFVDYVEFVQRAARDAGEEPASWWRYALHAPFPTVLTRDADRARASERIRRAIEREYQASRRYLAKHGEPSPGVEPTRHRVGKGGPDRYLKTAIHRDHAERVARIEWIRTGRQPLQAAYVDDGHPIDGVLDLRKGSTILTRRNRSGRAAGHEAKPVTDEREQLRIARAAAAARRKGID